MKPLSDLYKLIELESQNLDEYSDYYGIIKKFIGDPGDISTELKSKLQAEIDALKFVLSVDGELKPFSTWTDKDGLPIYDPDINDLKDEQLRYLSERLLECKSPFLKSRYSHVLWMSSKKNVSHAREAVDAYYKLSILLFTEHPTDKSRSMHLGLNNLKAAFNLSQSIKYRNKETKELVTKTLCDLSESKGRVLVIAMRLVEFILEKSRIFKRGDLIGFAGLLLQVKKNAGVEHSHVLVDFWKLIIRVEQRLGNDVSAYHNELGYVWEKDARERKDGSFVSTDFCRNAIASFKKAGNQDKVIELNKLYDELRQRVELQSIEHKIDITEIVKETKKFAKSVSSCTPDEILIILATDSRFIPSKKNLLEVVRKDSENSFLSMINSAVIDDKGNTSKHYTTKEEKEFEQLLFFYNHEIQLSSFNLLKEVIFESIYAGKLNFENVLNYLLKNSWYGHEVTLSARPDIDKSGRWLSQLAPSIVELFFAIDELLFYDRKRVTIIPSFDSLCVKIEGLLRSLAKYAGISTFTIKPDKSGREISEEKDLMRLLTDSELIEFLGEDDALFLRFLLTEKSGLNLRNKVAHSLMTFESYSLGTMMLVFLAIMRLSRFTLSEKQTEK